MRSSIIPFWFHPQRSQHIPHWIQSCSTVKRILSGESDSE
jgi:hypothetical protein